jgi:hypothetical protein
MSQEYAIPHLDVLRCGISNRSMSAQGQNENSPILGLCQLLPPAPDIGLPMLPPLCAKSCREQLQQGRPLFDHLVGEQLHRVGDVEAERAGRLHVDDELELGRLHNRCLSGVCAL